MPELQGKERSKNISCHPPAQVQSTTAGFGAVALTHSRALNVTIKAEEAALAPKKAAAEEATTIKVEEAALAAEKAAAEGATINKAEDELTGFSVRLTKYQLTP